MPDHLKIARFDGEALVFNPVSWHTHLFNQSAVQALDALASGPKSRAELVSAILGAPEADDWIDEDLQMADALLAELESVGLIECDTNPPCASPT